MLFGEGINAGVKGKKKNPLYSSRGFCDDLMDGKAADLALLASGVQSLPTAALIVRGMDDAAQPGGDFKQLAAGFGGDFRDDFIVTIAA
ncbi:MAG: hypothetical protein HY835_06570, partial [Anaerolineae bacterium]|nr:hypothetical protein [Anaerolineae bacterium]